jgi:hypothetical protein
MIMSAHAILELRQQKYYTCFAQAELNNVLMHKKLSQSAKLLWVALNNQTKGNIELKITHTLGQMGKLIARKVRCVQGLVNELKEFGYLKLVQSKNPDGVLTHQINLPQSALNDVSQSLNRGEAAPTFAKASVGKNTPTQFFAPTPAETCVPPTQKPAPLYNKYNNKNNHMSVTLDNDLEEGRRLHQHSQHLWDVKFADIQSPRERSRKVNAEFSESERVLIAKYSEHLEENPEPLGVQPQPNPKLAEPKPKVAANEQIEIQGETFSVESEVKKLVCTQIPKLIATNQLKGRAANLSATELQREALFYATKAGSRGNNIIDQRHRFFIFRKMIKNGDWQQPKGLVNREIVAREQSWQQQKNLEAQNAKQFMGLLSKPTMQQNSWIAP